MTATAQKLDLNDLTWEQWEEEFQPMENQNNDGYGPSIGNVMCMFETYGSDLNEVMNADQNCVWTLIEGDEEIEHEDGFMETPLYIVSGVHLVNRLGFFITSKSHNGEHIEVLVD